MVIEAPFHWSNPKTWPWMVYVWIAFLLLGWVVPAWKWWRRRRATSWPIVQGRIELVEITQPRFSLNTRRGSYVVELGYLYSVAGATYSGRYRRECGTDGEAVEFIRDLKDKAVAVHHNPTKPSDSSVLEADIEMLQQARAPADESFTMGGTVPAWTTPFLWFFAALSAIGLALSLWVHVQSLLGHTFSPITWALHIGIFVVWFPAVFASQRMVGNINRRDVWKLALRSAPEWMKYMMYGFFGYALINFFIFWSQAPSHGSGAETPASMWRGFSGHWMAFYSSAMAMLYSAARNAGTGPHCLNGHAVPRGATFCARCGQPVLRSASNSIL